MHTSSWTVWRPLAAAILCAAVLPGCWPTTSAESIHRDADRKADPALVAPYLEPGAPASADLPQTPASATPSPAKPAPAAPVYQDAEVPTVPAGFRLWIGGHEATIPQGERTARLAADIPTEPMVRFQLDESLGQFRSIVVQIYSLKAGQRDPDSGVSVMEPGQPTFLAPDRDVFLPMPGGHVVIRHIGTGRVMPWYVLRPDADYEFQFAIGGSKRAGSLTVRAHTAPTKPATPPPAAKSSPDTGQLPEGVQVQQP